MDSVTRQAYEVLHADLGASLFHESARFPPGQPLRLLITGSRTWTDEEAIKVALRPWWRGGTTTLVHGACPRGADAIADRIWTQAGGKVDRWRANWTKYKKAAGHIRNKAMIDGGADFAIAFLRTDSSSPGTRSAIELLRAAHIPLQIVTGPDLCVAVDSTRQDRSTSDARTL
jgi:YspA, cpYpsA-related SLOG family